MSITPVSKVGDWKTIQQRELKASGARKKQRRALAAASTTAGAAGALAMRNPGAARAAMGQARNVRNLPKGTRATGVGRMARANPTGAAIAGLAGASGASLGVAGSQRGVEAYHQHKINQRRRANRKGVSKTFDPVVPASRRRPQVAARIAVRRPNRKKNPFLIQKAERRSGSWDTTALSVASAGTTAAGIGASTRGNRLHNRGYRQATASMGGSRSEPIRPRQRRGVYNITSSNQTPRALMARGNQLATRGNRMLAAGAIGGGTTLGVEAYRSRKNSVSKKEWSDRRLARHKRAQSYLSSGGATLGIGALGAAGVAAATKNPRAAARLTRLTKKPVGQIRQKANRASPALTTGSAGVGGIGGFNFAAIQSQEAKRGQKVKKSMSTSVWGIDHGVVSKNWDRRDRTAAGIGGVGSALGNKFGLGQIGAGAYGASQANKGRRAAVGGRVAGRSFVEGAGGAIGGGILGAGIARGNPVATGLAGAAGAIGGSAHGAGAAMRNARRRGDLNPVRKADEKDEKKMRVSDAFAQPAANDKKKDDKKKTVDTSGAKVVQ